jgi:hypothetical protein
MNDFYLLLLRLLARQLWVSVGLLDNQSLRGGLLRF